MKTNLFQNRRGFTLMELIIAMGVVAIAAAIAIPAVHSFLPGYRLKIAAQDMSSNFKLARIEAIKRNSACTVSFDLDPNGKPFRYTGWFDTDNDSVVDSGEAQLFAVTISDYPGVSFDTDQGTNGLTLTNNPFKFNPRGLGDTQGTIYLKNNKNSNKQIIISLAGGVRIN